MLVEKRKRALCVGIIDYLQQQSMIEDENNINNNSPNPKRSSLIVRAELALVVGKLCKAEKNYDKALLAFEECFYLGVSSDDYRLKIKSIILMSACYLERGELHRAILYYQKLVDIETTLLASQPAMVQTDLNTSTNEEIINLELRLAVRQNLYMTHLRLGKLRACVYYLGELIEIIGACLKPLADIDKLLSGRDTTALEEFFEFVQVKIDASLELAKLYFYFDEFTSMRALLERMSKFSERMLSACDSLSERQQNVLRFFRIKTYSMLGVCLAGVRELRSSRLATKKSLALVDQEIERKQLQHHHHHHHQIIDSTTPHYLKSLYIECLMDACSSLSQTKRTYKQMREFNGDVMRSGEARFSAHELVASTVHASRTRIVFARTAYVAACTLIDPGLRVRVTFNLALALYDNHLYQSAAFYFSQLLSISIGLLNNNKPKSSFDNDFYNDLNPDYHLEAGVYLVKCYLMIDYFGVKSTVEMDESKLEFRTEPMEDLQQRCLKSIENIIKYAIFLCLIYFCA